MSDRIFAVAWLVVCAIIVISIWRIAVPLSYEPVGPKAFPLLLAAMMTMCCLALIVRPDSNSARVNFSVLRQGSALVGVLLAYAVLFSTLGFPLSTALMVVAVSRIFGGSWKTSMITAAGIAIGSFLLFDQVLEVGLPLGGLLS